MSKERCRLGIESLENRLALTNDPLFGSQWALSSINAFEAWNSVSLNNRPIVAIVDSGVDLNHPDLKDNFWVNSKEIVGDNVDNDNNGYVDDINGWNFAGWNGDVQDRFYHGTFVAGIVGAIKDNGVGIAGVAPSVRIMPLKFQGDNGLGYAGGAAAAINYAVDMKLRGENVVVINISWTTGFSDNAMVRSAIQRASDNDIIVVIAAGNDGSNLDVTPRYPSTYNFANTISVAAINPDKSLAGYSNYGKNSIDMGAPGSSIQSTLPNSNYGSISGSSFAAPQVSGAVALLKSINLYYSPSQIKQAILDGASRLVSWADKVRCGFLDLIGAVNRLKTMVPSYAPKVVTPIAPPVTNVGIIQSKLQVVNISRVKGWAADSVNASNKMVVQISINGVVRYSVLANMYNNSSRKNNGFDIFLSRSYFHKGSNLVSITVKDAINNRVLNIYSGYIRR